MPHLAFGTPRKLPKAEALSGRVLLASIVIVGAVVAAELYGIRCPVALVEDFDAFAGAERLRVRTHGERAQIFAF